MAKKKSPKKISKKAQKIREPEKDPRIELLKSIVEDLVNKQAVPILDLLSEKKPVNEFMIAEKLGLTINQTRNILYKLSDVGLVTFTRKKDKRKGWYIYFWSLNTHQSLLLLEEKLKKKKQELFEQLRNRKNSRFYVCKTCGIEVNEETALINNFTCPECTSIYELMDNTEMVKNIEREIERVNKEIAMVSEEVKKNQEKLDKAKVKKIAKEEREKKARRRAARELRKAEQKKAERKLQREKAKKKSKKKNKKKKI